ncbi:MAG: hypothetical protein KGS00_04345 [Alphaproteobacteria bacterium]|nr:hypothetical protein [Alphaproteobacteria bacterium]
MMQLFAQIEQSDISIWVRESLWAFPTLLVAHAISMGIVAGGGMMLALRALGVAQGVPYRALGQFAPLMGWGGLIASVSGGLLLAGYPAKALTNPVFALKFVFLAAAISLGRFVWTRSQAEHGRAGRSAGTRWAAGLSVLMWVGVIAAGRFLAYTHRLLLVS